MALALVALLRFDMSFATNKMARDRMGNEVLYKPNRTNLRSHNLEDVCSGVCQTRGTVDIIASLAIFLNKWMRKAHIHMKHLTQDAWRAF